MGIMSVSPGTKVHYTTGSGKICNGIIKSWVEAKILTEVFVVYNCGNDWDNYHKYTGVRTKINELKPGWKKKITFNIPKL